jgi:hypothetical protein
MESVSKLQILKTRHIRKCSKGSILEGLWKNTVRMEENKKKLHKKRKMDHDKQELI